MNVAALSEGSTIQVNVRVMNPSAESLTSARAYAEAGQFDTARQVCVEALRNDPNHADLWHCLGCVMFLTGQWAVAMDCFQKALGFGAERAEVYCHLGLACRGAGNLDAAIESLQQALKLDPAHHDSLTNLGVVLLETDNPAGATRLFQAALTNNPDDLTTRSNLGNAFKSQQRYEEAEAEYRAVLHHAPEHLETVNNLGAVLVAMERHDEADQHLSRVVLAHPDLVEARVNLGIALCKSRRLPEAINHFHEVLSRDGDNVIAWKGLADSQLDAGDAVAANKSYAQAARLDPDHAATGSNVVYTSQFLPGITAQRMAELYADWDRNYATALAPARPEFTNDPNPERRLRLGIISPNLRAHAAMHLTLGAFEHLNRDQCETYFYTDRPDRDEITQRVEQCADHWCHAFELTDEELADRIRSDGIDLLLVMAGHTDLNRQLVAARKPAPVQIAWTGDPSGQRAMDYLIADRYLIPEEFEESYTETIIRMPHDYAIFEPPASAPDIEPSPCKQNGHITFGSFNQTSKYNEAVLDTWSQILLRVPGSRLVLIGKSVNERRESLLAPFEAAGVSADRIELHDMIPRDDLLATYNRIDIVLDPFPFSGGITTLEALWMGVPTVTLPAETFAGRTSVTHLWNAGLTDTTASSREEYLDIAEQLARDHDRLALLRKTLRDQLRNSPVCNKPQFALDLGEVLRSAWKSWIRQQPDS